MESQVTNAFLLLVHFHYWLRISGRRSSLSGIFFLRTPVGDRRKRREAVPDTRARGRPSLFILGGNEAKLLCCFRSSPFMIRWSRLLESRRQSSTRSTADCFASAASRRLLVRSLLLISRFHSRMLRPPSNAISADERRSGPTKWTIRFVPARRSEGKRNESRSFFLSVVLSIWRLQRQHGRPLLLSVGSESTPPDYSFASLQMNENLLLTSVCLPGVGDRSIRFVPRSAAPPRSLDPAGSFPLTALPGWSGGPNESFTFHPLAARKAGDRMWVCKWKCRCAV